LIVKRRFVGIAAFVRLARCPTTRPRPERSCSKEISRARLNPLWKI
jgi:hypothetical protein